MNYCPACGTHYTDTKLTVCPRDGRLLWLAGSGGITIAPEQPDTRIVPQPRP